MTDQLRCIGFDFDSDEKLSCFFDEHWAGKTLIDLEDGVYLRMDVKPGIACWMSVGGEGHQLLDWDMHIDSGRKLPCAFGEQLSADEQGQSGIVSLTLNPGGEELAVTASCPALALWPEREPGAPGLASLALYAGEWSTVTDAIEGIRAKDDDNQADVTGRVLSTERLRNGWSGLEFRHAVLQCRGMELDLYCAAGGGMPVPENGTVISARVYVTCLCEAGVIR